MQTDMLVHLNPGEIHKEKTLRCQVPFLNVRYVRVRRKQVHIQSLYARGEACHKLHVHFHSLHLQLLPTADYKNAESVFIDTFSTAKT